MWSFLIVIVRWQFFVCGLRELVVEDLLCIFLLFRSSKDPTMVIVAPVMEGICCIHVRRTIEESFDVQWPLFVTCECFDDTCDKKKPLLCVDQHSFTNLTIDHLTFIGSHFALWHKFVVYWCVRLGQQWIDG